MKNRMISILLCLLLVLSLATPAMAATLDTAALTIKDNKVTIDSRNDAVLKELASQGRTAKIAVPYGRNATDYYVLKDYAALVSHKWDEAGNNIQFEVPGAGTYVIKTGRLGTLEEEINERETEVVLLSDTNLLTINQTVKVDTVIYANNHTIRAAEGEKTLTAEKSLKIQKINGVTDIRLGKNDRITFDEDGLITVEPVLDSNAGYGSFQVTQKISGKEVTKTYFLVAGEKLTITKNGKISGNKVFAAANEKDKLPPYEIHFDDHENTHVKGKSGSIVAQCNGLFDYYTKVTITESGSSKAEILAEKVNGKDVTVSGVKISEGSTVLTLKSSYLNTLSSGTYTLTFHYADGAAVKETIKIAKEAAQPDPTNPKTGDWFAHLLAVVS